MNQELILIYNVLHSEELPITTGQIAKRIFNESGHRVSSKIIQNYLWSYFRDIIMYDSTNYTYQLKEYSKYDWTNIKFVKGEKNSRAIEPIVRGSSLEIMYDDSIPKEIYIKAFVEVYFNSRGKKKNIDLIKMLNQYIDNI